MQPTLKRAAAAALATLVLTGPAAAATLFSETFDGENGGQVRQDFAGFAQFDIENPLLEAAAGQVSLVNSQLFGSAGPGLGVLLHGSEEAGRLVSKNFIAFKAGDVVTLSLDYAGGQNSQQASDLGVNLLFQAPTAIGDIKFGGFTPSASGFFPNGDFQADTKVGNSDPFHTLSVTFTAQQDGAFKFSFDPFRVSGVVDNVLVTSDAVVGATVPEPATWGLMILGFGLAGAALRQRRGALAA